MSKARDLADGTFDTDTLVVDAANNRVGIKEDLPNADLVVKQSGATFTPSGNTVALFQRNTATGSGCMVSILSGNNSAADLNFADADDEDVGRIRYYHSDNSMQFQTNASEAMRLTSDGWFLVGDSSAPSGSNNCVGAFPGGFIITSRNTVGTAQHLVFRNPNGDVGSISIAGSSTSYLTSSDYRLKENVTDLTGASDRIKQIPVRRFNFIADPDTTVDGFLAHEVQAVVPEAVTGTQDGMKDEEYEVTPAVLDDDGNVVTEAVMGTRSVPDYQGIDQSKLVPLITAALREALAKIETLETEMTSVKARLDALETP